MPDSLNLLALIVALSAYLAAIRFFAQERLASTLPPPNARALKVLLFRLVFADVPLVIAGVLLTWQLFEGPLQTSPGQTRSWWVAFLFCVAVGVMALYHLLSWKRSIEEYWKLPRLTVNSNRGTARGLGGTYGPEAVPKHSQPGSASRPLP